MFFLNLYTPLDQFMLTFNVDDFSSFSLFPESVPVSNLTFTDRLNSFMLSFNIESEFDIFLPNLNVNTTVNTPSIFFTNHEISVVFLIFFFFFLSFFFEDICLGFYSRFLIVFIAAGTQHSSVCTRKKSD